MQLLTEKQKIAFSILLGVVFLAFVGVYLWGDIAPRNSKQTGEFYVNAKGQQWTLPEGDYSFTVASSKYPKFLGGTVSPVKVFPGDTQKMVVSIASPVPLKKVTASIDTDNRTQNFTLRLRESKAISADFFKNQKYLVGEDNKLIINQGSSYAATLVNELVAKAEAQALVEYTYEGEWIVNDTHTKTYHTKFIVEDENGGADSITLAWSDPECNFQERNGVLELKDNCSPTGAEGVDGMSANLTDFTVQLQDGAAFYWNGGLEVGGPVGPKEIVMGNGSFILGNNTQIKEALLYYDDADEDTWAGDVAYSLGCEVQCTPQIRVKDSPSRPWANPTPLNGGLDCADNNASVFPGQTLYFGETYEHPQLGGSYDYDCNNEVVGGWGNNEDNPGSVSSVYSRVFVVVGKDNDGNKYCEAGIEILPEQFDFCGIFSDYSIDKCEAGFSDVRSSEEIFPKDAISGFMTRDCEVCIGTTLRGFCH